MHPIYFVYGIIVLVGILVLPFLIGTPLEIKKSRVSGNPFDVSEAWGGGVCIILLLFLLYGIGWAMNSFLTH